MPSAEEFRVGDRVETRRSEAVPERFRQRRAMVVAVEDVRMRLQFANPPMDDWSDEPDHGGWWRSEQVRLVERRLRLGKGARVIVSNPAWVYPNGTGHVAADYYGAECRVIRKQREYENCWVVRRIIDGVEQDGENYIHENYLAVIEEGSGVDYEVGDLVAVAEVAYARAFPQAHRALNFGPGTLGTLEYNCSGGQWEVRFGHGVEIIHENWFAPAPLTGEPLLSVGDVVDVGPSPRVADGQPVLVGWEGTHAVVVSTVNGSVAPMVRNVHTGAQTRIHQDHLTRVECEAPPEGAVVEVLGGAMFREGRTEDIGVVLSARTIGQNGTVIQPQTESGNVRVAMHNGRSALVHHGFLRVFSDEEAARVIRPRDRVRVALAMDVREGMRGRIGIAEAQSSGLWLIRTSAAGEEYVHPDNLTKIQRVSTVERCASCGEATGDDPHVYNENRYCANCAVACVHCETTYRINKHSGGSVVWSGEAWECARCVAHCSHCGTRCRVDDMVLDEHSAQRYCAAHVRECADPECSQMAFGTQDHCTECRTDNDLGRWRHTEAVLWLGGPVRQKGGYYIGFEHEISAASPFALRPLRRWSEEHLGARHALDPKPDSSVEGFEIATQPMTPAFFEEVDWESYMDMINANFPLRREEPEGHGLHVHIGRQAFRRERLVKVDRHGRPLRKPVPKLVTDQAMLAAFTYLLTRNHDQLERIGRRAGSRWSPPVVGPVRAAMRHVHSDLPWSRQRDRIDGRAPVRNKNGDLVAPTSFVTPRGAVNLTNNKTIEIRTARSTRSADDLRDAVRVVYLAAEYIRMLRNQGSINPKAVNWSDFSSWVAEVMPQAHRSISGQEGLVTARPVTAMAPSLMEAFTTPEAEVVRTSGVVNSTMEVVPPPVRAEVVADPFLLAT